MSEKASQITVENLYDLKETIAGDIFEGVVYPWEVLPKIHDFIIELGKRLPWGALRGKGGEYLDCKECNGSSHSLLKRSSDCGRGCGNQALCLHQGQCDCRKGCLWWEIPQN